jgi:hypothetical protein
MTYHSPLVMVAIGLLGDEADRNQLDARRKPSAVGGLPTPSGVFHGLVRLPTIPHRECLIVSGPSKILLRNATSTLSISEIGAPVRRLRPKSRPFVVAPELAIPIFFGDRFPSIFHVISSWASCSAALSFVFMKTILRRDRSRGSVAMLQTHSSLRGSYYHFNYWRCAQNRPTRPYLRLTQME